MPIICVIRCVMAVSYAARLRLSVGGAALDSRLACPPEDESLPTHRPIRARQNVRSAPPRGVGRGRITRQHHGYPASRPDFFYRYENGSLLRNCHGTPRLGVRVLPLHVTLIPIQSTPEQATDLPSYMTLIPLQSGSKRAIALASTATLICLQSAPDSGGV